MPVNPNIWAARKAAGLSQKALAAKAGMDQADVSLIENASWLPPEAVRERLAEALGVPVATLFPDDVALGLKLANATAAAAFGPRGEGRG